MSVNANSTIASGLENLQLLDVRAVASLLGVNRRTVWRMSAEGDAGLRNFPKCLRLSPKVCRWRLTDVATYIEDLVTGCVS